MRTTLAVYKLKNYGPATEPCGIPHVSGDLVEN